MTPGAHGAYPYLPHDWTGLELALPWRPPPPIVVGLCVVALRDPVHAGLGVGR